jgi:hypothetical protein
MFRLQSKQPARHDMLNNDAVILHHNALHHSLEHFLLDLESGGDYRIPHMGAKCLDPFQEPQFRRPVPSLLFDLLDPCPQLLALLGQPLAALGPFWQCNDFGLIGVK